MNNFKRVLIIALCSILCVCTVPRFSLRSEAASTATYALYQTLLNLSGYLTTRGYSIIHEHGSSIPSITDLQSMTYENMGNVLFDISMKLNAFGATHDSPYLGEEFVNAMSEASFRGSILLSKSTRDLVDLWLQTSTSDGSIILSDITDSLSDYVYPGSTSFSVPINGTVREIVPSSDTVIFSVLTDVETSAGYLVFIPSSIDGWQWSGRFYEAPGTYPPYTSATYLTSYGGKQLNVYIYSCFSINLLNYNIYRYGVTNQGSYSFVDSLIEDLYSGELDEVATGSYIATQITNTSDSDLLTSTNTISDEADVEGPTTIYLPSQSEFESLIDDYNSQSISYEDFLKALGINSVSEDATVAEKEEALEVVVTPSEDYLWFTKTRWGAEAIDETRKASAATRAEEDSLADSIANTANGGSDPDDPDNKSRGKGLLALLLIGLGIWNTPIIAGDGTSSGGGTDDDSGDGSGDTSGYLAESIAGMAVAGSLVDDFFDAAGGSNGYGLIYTVGASFVIFSVIIGAANYFGALFHGSDTKQNIKASGKKSTPGKEKKGG